MLERREDVSIEEAFENALKKNDIHVIKRKNKLKHVYVVDEDDIVYEVYSNFTIKERPIRTIIRRIGMFFKR